MRLRQGDIADYPELAQTSGSARRPTGNLRSHETHCNSLVDCREQRSIFTICQARSSSRWIGTTNLTVKLAVRSASSS